VLVKKKCKACKRPFIAEKSEPFVTCPKCRVPAPAIAGGCTHWRNCQGDGKGEVFAGPAMRGR
jgi:hypothetical protein